MLQNEGNHFFQLAHDEIDKHNLNWAKTEAETQDATATATVAPPIFKSSQDPDRECGSNTAVDTDININTNTNTTNVDVEYDLDWRHSKLDKISIYVDSIGVQLGSKAGPVPEDDIGPHTDTRTEGSISNMHELKLKIALDGHLTYQQKQCLLRESIVYSPVADLLLSCSHGNNYGQQGVMCTKIEGMGNSDQSSDIKADKVLMGKSLRIECSLVDDQESSLGYVFQYTHVPLVHTHHNPSPVASVTSPSITTNDYIIKTTQATHTNTSPHNSYGNKDTTNISSSSSSNRIVTIK